MLCCAKRRRTSILLRAIAALSVIGLYIYILQLAESDGRNPVKITKLPTPHSNYVHHAVKRIDNLPDPVKEADMQAQIGVDSKSQEDSSFYEPPVIAILVLSCDRPEVTKLIDQILVLRPSPHQFPLIVSQDCGDEATREAILSYKKEITFIEHLNHSAILYPLSKREKKRTKLMETYFKISRHYKWALTQAFDVLGYKSLIIFEDDMELAPDVLRYFASAHPLMDHDPRIWCVSAWNDHGLDHLVRNDSELFWRTDFFPGLGWMLRKDIWNEIKPKWPDGFWDDWMRKPENRRGRQCITPELPRVNIKKFKGMQTGEKFFDTYLSKIALNKVPAKFGRLGILGNITAYNELFRQRLQFEHPDRELSNSPDSRRELENMSKDRTMNGKVVNMNFRRGDLRGHKQIGLLVGYEPTLYDKIPRMAYLGIIHMEYGYIHLNVIAR